MVITRENKTAVIVVGPTASGKTSIAIDLAKHFKTEIISADSRQCFRELNIGVGRPSEEELTTVKHYFIASHSINDNVSAGTFEQYALEKANALFREHDVVVVSGGTGLYIKAFCEGMDAIPNVPGEVRETIISEFKEKGLEWLQKEVEQKDPSFYKSGEIKNPQRLMRALEVMEFTGRSIVEFRKGLKASRAFTIIKIGLELSKEELHRNIEMRVDKMIAQGLVEEVRELLPHKDQNALQTVGYPEIFAYLDGKISLDKAIDLIKKNTKQYARRQMTWFRKDKEIKWFAPSAIEEMKGHLPDAL
jgi:tRNA dimethylallyltransferase